MQTKKKLQKRHKKGRLRLDSVALRGKIDVVSIPTVERAISLTPTIIPTEDRMTIRKRHLRSEKMVAEKTTRMIGLVDSQ